MGERGPAEDAWWDGYYLGTVGVLSIVMDERSSDQANREKEGVFRRTFLFKFGRVGRDDPWLDVLGLMTKREF